MYYVFQEYYNRYNTILNFPNEFNQSLDNIDLIPSLEEIYFGGFNSIFSQNLTDMRLPNDIVCLCFKKYELITINTLPIGLTKLKLYSINSPITNLPITLCNLYISYEIMHKIDLIKLPFGCKIKGF